MHSVPLWNAVALYFAEGIFDTGVLVKAYAVEPPLAIGTRVLDLQQGRKGHEGRVPQATARSVELRLTNSLS
jgi:hypothetical protein